MNDIPEYSSLSQMAYVLDQKSLLNFFEFFLPAFLLFAFCVNNIQTNI